MTDWLVSAERAAEQRYTVTPDSSMINARIGSRVARHQFK
ncbi:Unknown protein sequence [Pseudomonas syringae pv. cilantro]|uniref:Uncharacterized protein n=1 Tax=Pseudomonas syringae pv. cilantro TaxID=81035 RepID=A0A0N0X9T3_PSESX|nr:Unknown protein sequence [Pseudomonas syringae pv. cilantro]